jgi:aspartyl-tRNA(Asn)/glutamyl-tRNA(Gln) amidotransferase subunit A
VSRFGVLPLDFTLDHMGPLTRSVRDAAVVLNAIAGFDSRDDTSSGREVENYVPPEGASIRGLRIGVPENFYFERIDPEVGRAIESALRTAAELGAEIVAVRVPDIGALNLAGRVILLSEASAVLEPYLERRGDFGKDVLALLDQGRFMTATDYVNAQRLRRVKQREFRAVFEHADCLVTPATPAPAPRIGQHTIELGGVPEDVRLASTRLVRGINVLGLPAVSLPCGFNTSGLPLGMQIVGRPFEEALILRLAAALEDAGISPRRTPAVL